MFSHCWEQNKGSKGLWINSALVQLGLQPVNCASQLPYLIHIPTSSATAHTHKCPQQGVREVAVISPKKSGSGIKELLGSAGAWNRNLLRGSVSLQSLAAGPAPWAFCGLSHDRRVLWLVYPELNIQKSIDQGCSVPPKDFTAWVTVFLSSVFSGNLD